MKLLEWVSRKIEVKIVLKLIKMLTEGKYSLKFATIEDFEEHLKIERIYEETDGLVYRKTVMGFYANKFVELNLWSSGISIVKVWVQW